MKQNRHGMMAHYSACILAILFSGQVLAAECDETNRDLEPFAAGDGSDFEPYLICTPHQFNQISTQYADKHFIIGSDLDFASYDGTNRMIFNMIGSDSIPFTGSMDGQGHLLNNIYLTTVDAIQDRKLLGVFRKTDGANIKNLQVKIDIGGKQGLISDIGGLIGAGNLTLIDNIQMQVNMRGANSAGGLAARLKSSQATNIDVAGKIELTYGNDAVGGVVGLMENTSLEAIHSNVEIGNLNQIGISDVAGIAAIVWKSSQLCNAYYDGKIAIWVEPDQTLDTDHVAGLVSRMSFSTLKNVYMNGTVDPNESLVSPTVLNITNDQNSQSVFWNMTKEPHTVAALGTGVAEEKLKQVKWLKSKGFMPEIWNMKKGTFPTLKKVESLYLQCKNPDIAQD